ncbi:MAG: hypothetical protein ACREND_14605 [Gemmatimonadaceae bacterium]
MHARGAIRLATISTVVLAAACASSHTAPSSATNTVNPGGPALEVPSLENSATNVIVSLQRPTGDTVAHAVSVLRLTGVRAESGTMLTKDWSPPFQSSDTLVVEKRTLRPQREVLVFNHVRREYRYDGAHVTGTIQYPDSAPQAFDKTFEEPVFAFNEVEPFVRSLDYRKGLTVVLPLFSEVDAALEHDTVSVVGRASVAGHDTWIVRFADPVITTVYMVDARTRDMTDAVTTQRQSGLRFHYAYAGTGKGPAGIELRREP